MNRFLYILIGWILLGVSNLLIYKGYPIYGMPFLFIAGFIFLKDIMKGFEQ